LKPLPAMDTSLVWRLRKEEDEAECRVELTAAQGYTVTIDRGGECAFSATATDWPTARKLIVERRDRMITEGWTQSYP
jgi:hypothetical protein